MENVEEEQFYVSPIATPMASDNMRKKLLKLTRKGMKIQHLEILILTCYITYSNRLKTYKKRR